MATLVGQSTEGTGTALALEPEKARAWKFTASASGTVTELHITLTSATATQVRLAIQADNAGKPAEGVLGGGENEALIETPAAGTFNVTLPTSVAVTSGTVYWLTALALGGNANIKRGATTVERKGGTKRGRVASVLAADWSAEETLGPVAIWATGTEGGGKTTTEATATLRAGAAVSPAAKLVGNSASVLRAGSRLVASSQMVARTTATVRTGARLVLEVSGRRTFEEAVLLRAGTRLSTETRLVLLVTMDHALPWTIPFIVGRTVGVSVGAGARLQPSTRLVMAAAPSLRAGARLSASTRMIAQSSSTLRTGARVLVTLFEAQGKQARILIVSQPQARVSVTSQPAARIGVVSEPDARITI